MEMMHIADVDSLKASRRLAVSVILFLICMEAPVASYAQHLSKGRLYIDHLALTESARSRLVLRSLSFMNLTRDEMEQGEMNGVVAYLLETTSTKSVDWATSAVRDWNRSRGMRAAAHAILTVANQVYIPKDDEPDIDPVLSGHSDRLVRATREKVPLIPPSQAPPARFLDGFPTSRLSTETLTELRQELQKALQGHETWVKANRYCFQLMWDIYINQTGDVELLKWAWDSPARMVRQQNSTGIHITGRVPFGIQWQTTRSLVLYTLAEGNSDELLEFGRQLVRSIASAQTPPETQDVTDALRFLQVTAIRGRSGHDLVEYLDRQPGWFYTRLDSLCRAVSYSAELGFAQSSARQFRRCAITLEKLKVHGLTREE